MNIQEPQLESASLAWMQGLSDLKVMPSIQELFGVLKPVSQLV